MQIQSINNYSVQNKSYNPQFKSVMPVVHWVAETNASYAPEILPEVARKFNENIISRLNKKSLVIKQEISKLMNKISELTEKIKVARSDREKIAKEKKIEKYRRDLADLYLTQRVQNYVAGLDPEYAKNPVARNFYKKNVNSRNYEPVVYIATGGDALYLDSLGRDIGVARSSGDAWAEEAARKRYWIKGDELVAEKSKNFRTKTGEQADLHVKMETLRDREGNEVGYNIIDMKPFPKYGPNNPFVMLGWINNKK